MKPLLILTASLLLLWANPSRAQGTISGSGTVSGSGYVDDFNHNVTPPSANFTNSITNLAVMTNTTVWLTNTSSGDAPTSLLLNWGDGTTTSTFTSTASHTYTVASSTNYTVILAETNAGGTSSTNWSVTILQSNSYHWAWTAASYNAVPGSTVTGTLLANSVAATDPSFLTSTPVALTNGSFAPVSSLAFTTLQTSNFASWIAPVGIAGVTGALTPPASNALAFQFQEPPNWGQINFQQLVTNFVVTAMVSFGGTNTDVLSDKFGVNFTNTPEVLFTAHLYNFSRAIGQFGIEMSGNVTSNSPYLNLSAETNYVVQMRFDWANASPTNQVKILVWDATPSRRFIGQVNEPSYFGSGITGHPGATSFMWGNVNPEGQLQLSVFDQISWILLSTNCATGAPVGPQ